MKIGANITKLRNRHNLSKKDFSEQIGCTSKQLIEWEKGRCYPSYPALQSIIDTFHIMDIYAFLWGDYFENDSIVVEVSKKLYDRHRVGYKKYKTTLDRKDLSVEEWLNHAREEAMDLSLYLTKILSIYEDNKHIDHE